MSAQKYAGLICRITIYSVYLYMVGWHVIIGYYRCKSAFNARRLFIVFPPNSHIVCVRVFGFGFLVCGANLEIMDFPCARDILQSLLFHVYVCENEARTVTYYYVTFVKTIAIHYVSIYITSYVYVRTLEFMG